MLFVTALLTACTVCYRLTSPKMTAIITVSVFFVATKGQAINAYQEAGTDELQML